MAKNLIPSHLLIIFITFSLIISTSIADLTLRDLEAAIFALRVNGFDLFANSIAVSELSFQLLNHGFNSSSSNGGNERRGFTFLAPPNSVLFSLDMTSDAFTYVRSLRFHVIPRHLSFSELRNVSLSSKPRLETLVPGHFISIAPRRRTVTIDGVRVAFPDLYLSSEIAVHGLAGILRSSNEEFYNRLHSVASPPSIHVRSPPPSIDEFSPKIEQVSAPVEAYSPQYEGIPPYSQQFGGIPATIDAFSPEFEGIPPYMQEFEGTPVPMDAFSPEISEAMLPIDASSPVFGAIPASYDAAFTGGSYNSISAPPNDVYSPESTEIPTPSPSIDHSSSPNPSPSIEHSESHTHSLSNDHWNSLTIENPKSPVYAEWSGADFLSPRIRLPDWSVPPLPFTLGERQDSSGSVNKKNAKKKIRKNHHYHHHHHHLERGH